MSPTVIRFRCRRCERINSVAISKAGKPFVCPSCFAPMVVPEVAVAAVSNIPTAEALSDVPAETRPTEPVADEPVACFDEKGHDRDTPPVFPQTSSAPGRPVEAEPDVEACATVSDERLVPGPDALGLLAGAGWGVAIATVGLIAAMGAIAGLSRLEGGRRAGDRIAGTVPPGARSGERGNPGASPIVAPRASRPDSEAGPPAPRPGPAPAILGVPASPVTLASHPVGPGQPPGLPIQPPPAATNPARVMQPAPAAAPPAEPARVLRPVPVAVSPAPPAEPARVMRPAPMATAPAPPAEPVKPIVVRRRQMLDQEALRKQLNTLPELALDDRTLVALLVQHGMTFATPAPTRNLPMARGGFEIPRDPRSSDPRARLHTVEARQPHGSRDTFALVYNLQPELTFLPWRLGEDCHLSKEPAENLQGLSRSLRDVLQKSMPPGDPRPDPESLRAFLLNQTNVPPAKLRSLGLRVDWVEPGAIPALLQLLMAERSTTRQVLVDVLARIPGEKAVAALARLSLFDLAPEVRERAIQALQCRSAGDYRPTLLDGLRYPWPPAADHAAEALVALGDREAVPTLIGLLDQPDPQGPTTVSRYGRPTTVVRSLVRINHLKNCLLCHAPSTSPTSDLVRGRVPSPGEALPPPRQYYGASEPGLFVRAEVTYIRQDFSVTQPVDGADPWPGQQRFDYLVAERPTSSRGPKSRSKKVAHPSPKPALDYPQRESVLFVLRELTGKDLGTSAQDWKAAAGDDAGPAAAKDSPDE